MNKIGMLVAAALMIPAASALAALQEGDGTRVDDRTERRQDRRGAAAQKYDGDGTRVDDRAERRQTATENYDGDGTRVDDRVERRESRRDAAQD